MSKWKQELNRLSLTEVQKEKMKQIVKQPLPEPAKRKSFVPIIAPTFVLLAIVFIWLQVSPPGNDVKTATTDIVSTTNVMTKEVIGLLAITMLLHAGAYLFVVFVALKVKRMEKFTAFRWLKYKIQHKQLFVIVTCICMTTLMIVAIVLYAKNVVILLQIVLVTLLLVNMCCWQLLSTKDSERSMCPHCGVVYSRKEIWKKSFYEHYEKCSSCGKGAYVDRKKGQGSLIPMYMGGMVGVFITNFNIPIWLGIGYIVAYTIFVVIYIIPYTTQFTKESDDQQPPLW